MRDDPRLLGAEAHRIGAMAGRRVSDPYRRGSADAAEWRIGWLEAMMADAVALAAADAWPWRVE